MLHLKGCVLGAGIVLLLQMVSYSKSLSFSHFISFSPSQCSLSQSVLELEIQFLIHNSNRICRKCQQIPHQEGWEEMGKVSPISLPGR